jgi:cell division protein FtsN
MKKVLLGGTCLCMVLALASCKSSESAYKKAYDKAKQQELAQPQVAEEPAEAPVVAPIEVSKTTTAAAGVRQEKVTVVSGNSLKDYSVICGSFGLKANAEGLRDYLEKEGYSPVIVFNSETAMYRVAVSTFDDRASAAEARDAFKAKYPNRQDFQGAWLLYRL